MHHAAGTCPGVASLNAQVSRPGEVVPDRVDPMDIALVVACISGASRARERDLFGMDPAPGDETEKGKDGRKSAARTPRLYSTATEVLYWTPLGSWAIEWTTSVTVDFFAYLSRGSGREQDAKLTTLFRFAYYLGWREFVRTEVQLLRFENEGDTRSGR